MPLKTQSQIIKKLTSQSEISSECFIFAFEQTRQLKNVRCRKGLSEMYMYSPGPRNRIFLFEIFTQVKKQFFSNFSFPLTTFKLSKNGKSVRRRRGFTCWRRIRSGSASSRKIAYFHTALSLPALGTGVLRSLASRPHTCVKRTNDK